MSADATSAASGAGNGAGAFAADGASMAPYAAMSWHCVLPPTPCRYTKRAAARTAPAATRVDAAARAERGARRREEVEAPRGAERSAHAGPTEHARAQERHGSDADKRAQTAKTKAPAKKTEFGRDKAAQDAPCREAPRDVRRLAQRAEQGQGNSAADTSRG